MKPGLDVRVKGVPVGKVAQIELVEHRAQLQLKIDQQYKIPQDAEAVISLKTPLGAKYVDLRFPAGTQGPFLADGDVIDNAHVGPELEDLLADGTAVLEAVDPDDAGDGDQRAGRRGPQQQRLHRSAARRQQRARRPLRSNARSATRGPAGLRGAVRRAEGEGRRPQPAGRSRQ